MTRDQWTATQWLAATLGVVLSLFGAVALRRTGFDDDAHAEVMGLHHTALLAMLELGIGLLVASAALVPGGGRGLLGLGGVALLGLGIAAFVDSSGMHAVLGTHAANGIALTAAGGLCVVDAIAAPVAATARRRLRHSTGEFVIRAR